MTRLLAQGAVNLALQGQTVPVTVGGGGMALITNSLGAISWIVSLAVFSFAIVVAFSPRFMAREPSEASAVAVGVRVGRPYIGSSALAGLAGIFFAFRLNAASPLFGRDGAQDAFFILFFSGAVFGNRAGNPVGVLIAALYLALLKNAMSIMGLDIFLQTILVLASAMCSGLFNLGYEALVNWLFKNRKAAAPAS